MSKKVSGQVYKVFVKDFPGKGGKPGNTWYSIKLEGDDLYYRCKASNPGNIDGKYVEFDADAFTEKQAEVTSKVTVVDRSTIGVATAQTSAPQTERDISIHYQSARKDALQLVDIALRNGAVKLPVKEAGRLQAVETLVDRYTATYFEDIATQGAVARANGTAEVQTEDAQKDVGEDE